MQAHVVALAELALPAGQGVQEDDAGSLYVLAGQAVTGERWRRCQAAAPHAQCQHCGRIGVVLVAWPPLRSLGDVSLTSAGEVESTSACEVACVARACGRVGDADTVGRAGCAARCLGRAERVGATH